MRVMSFWIGRINLEYRPKKFTACNSKIVVVNQQTFQNHVSKLQLFSPLQYILYKVAKCMCDLSLKVFTLQYCQIASIDAGILSLLFRRVANSKAQTSIYKPYNFINK